MADPITILGIINGSIGLSLKIGTIIHNLYEIRQTIKNAELTILSTATECETIQAAWGGIEAWAQKQERTDQRLLDRLGRSLMVGTMVMSALEEDLMLLCGNAAGRGSGFWHRARLAWKESTLR